MANLKNVENKEEVNLNAKNSRNINEYLSTHPSSETRLTVRDSMKCDGVNSR
jgi:predicted Zn-dependent protease